VYRRLVAPIATPEEATIEDIVITSLFLVVSLTVVTPVAVLLAGIPLLAVVALVGLAYAGFCVRTRRVASGAVSALFVLSIFGANVPLFAGEDRVHLSIYLVDLLALVLFLGCAADLPAVVRRVRTRRITLVAVGGLVVFVFWSYLAAIVGNGPSRVAAVVFAIQQTRYLFLFVVALLLVHRTDIRFAVYPLVISVAGNLVYAVAEAVVGHTLGLTYLGDTDGKLLGEFAVGPLAFQSGTYAGGYVGNIRELILLLLLTGSVFVFWSAYGDRLLAVASAVGVALVAFVVRLGDTDAGWMSLILVLSLVAAAFTLRAVATRDRGSARGALTAVTGIILSILLHADRFGSGSSESGAGTGSSTGAVTGTTSGDASPREWLLETVSVIPGVRVNTLGIRLTQYAAAIDVGFTYPLFGIGGYNFIFVSQEYGLPPKLGVHNTLLSHLAAVGIPGSFAYLAAISATLVLLLERVTLTSERTRLFWGCVLAGTLAFHAYSFWVVAYTWLAANAGFWMLSGAVVGAVGTKTSLNPLDDSHGPPAETRAGEL
jgi:hypothetical protein